MAPVTSARYNAEVDDIAVEGEGWWLSAWDRTIHKYDEARFQRQVDRVAKQKFWESSAERCAWCRGYVRFYRLPLTLPLKSGRVRFWKVCSQCGERRVSSEFPPVTQAGYNTDYQQSISGKEMTMANLDAWNPKPPYGGTEEHPKMAELVGNVLAFVRPGAPEPLETSHGVRDRVKLDALVVFERGSGKHTEYRGYGVWQESIQTQLNAGITVGRLTRPGTRYEVVEVGEKVLGVVEATLMELDLLEKAKPSTTYKEAKAELEDDDDF